MKKYELKYDKISINDFNKKIGDSAELIIDTKIEKDILRYFKEKGEDIKILSIHPATPYQDKHMAYTHIPRYQPIVTEGGGCPTSTLLTLP
jgi:hypothetical protein